MSLMDPPAESLIYENDKLYVCLASRPLSKGHCIIAWKADVEDLHLLERQDYLELMDMVERARDALLEAYGVEKVYLVYADEARHVHWHLVPRYNEKGMNILAHEPAEISDFSDTAIIRNALKIEGA